MSFKWKKISLPCWYVCSWSSRYLTILFILSCSFFSPDPYSPSNILIFLLHFVFILSSCSASSLSLLDLSPSLQTATGLIDYDQMEMTAKLFRPKLIIAGTSAYARLIDYARIKKVHGELSLYWNPPSFHHSFFSVCVCFLLPFHILLPVFFTSCPELGRSDQLGPLIKSSVNLFHWSETHTHLLPL